jgi:MSHA pilin protein MshA
MTKQKGFTLIELVVVIVILGILAVTAAPRFLNLQSDARASSLQGLKGAMAGASSIVFGKAAIDGKETNAAPEDVEGIAIAFGYPEATSAGIGAAVDGLSEDWDSAADAATDEYVSTFKADPELTDPADIKLTNCYVSYEYDSTVSGTTPTISVVDSDC